MTLDIKNWWLAVRPFSFPASAIPVLFGTAAAVAVGGAEFSFLNFILALAGMVMLQGAANLLNDVYDFRLGLDTQVFPASGAVVRRIISPGTALRASILLFTIGSIIGVYLAAASSWHILWIGILGVFIGVAYSYTVVGLKYRGFGDLCVFSAFGILGCLGAWTLQAKTPSWIPVVWAVPIGLHIIGILHANNWRDIKGDEARSSRSIALILGDRGSLIYYGCLLFLPFALVTSYIFIPRIAGTGTAMPAGCLVVFFSFPFALKLFKRGLQRHAPVQPADFVGLDGETGKLNLVFGLLLTAGVLAALI